ncbi:hypothetical protein IC235_03930 [Hymenobacter sp. BT664]|uniref:DUF4861 domain-containing protein n=1 Tax=Hymenobacter montanus TaxID=2771359 RepID=A0A927BBH1_9BACT|nr:hypothetical protein [Hymenobacter montanus]MBD2767042.1 hypothetical protein [Hymenobacter montanus]
MKLLPFLPLLALLAGACQQQSPRQATVATTVATVTTATPAEITPGAVALRTSSTKLTPDMLAFLQDNDLSPLWRNLAQHQEHELAVHNGFFGVDNYRIEFVFTSITRDATDPALFLVTGKNRYKKTISPFTGSIRITQLLNEQPSTPDIELQEDVVRVALGTFEFSEQLGTRTDGIFRGTMALDFFFNKNGNLEVYPFSGGKYGARGAGYRFTGNWASKSTNKTKPVMFAAQFDEIANEVLEDFSIGERDLELNPKYAKLGWENYWENEEWWAEPGAALAQVGNSKGL